MTPQQWRLARQIEFTVNRDVGRSIADLARMYRATVADVRTATWALCRQHKADFCAGYIVAVPRRKAGRSHAA